MTDTMARYEVETWQQPDGRTWTVRVTWYGRSATATAERLADAFDMARRELERE